MDTGWKYFKNKSSHSSEQDRQWQTVHAQIQFTLKYIIVSRKENLLYIRKIKCVKMMTAFIISSNLHKLAKFLHFRNHLVTIIGTTKLLHFKIPYDEFIMTIEYFLFINTKQASIQSYSLISTFHLTLKKAATQSSFAYTRLKTTDYIGNNDYYV